MVGAMATLTVYFPDGLYPEDFDPPIPADVNPAFAELIDLRGAQLLSSTSTEQTIQMANSLVFKFVGVDLTYDSAGRATGGTLTAVELYRADGTTLFQDLTGLERSFVDVYDAMGFFNGPRFGEWLMAGSDVIYGSEGDDNLDGGEGDDVFYGGGGHDFFRGGAGTDTYYGGEGNDQISFDDAHLHPGAYRGAFVDVAAKTLIDPWGNTETFDSIEAFRGSMYGDRFVGSDGDEVFFGMGGNDIIDGGGGFDEVRYDRDIRIGGNAGVTVDLQQGAAIDGFGRVDTLMNIEAVRGTMFNDIIIGDANDNRLRGEAGDDRLSGGAGNDRLIGGAGNDVLNGGAGNDIMEGGTGDDIYIVAAAGDQTIEHAGEGIDTVRSYINWTLSDNVERLELLGTAANGTGNELNNTLVGNASANVLRGEAGNDYIAGGGGNDTLYGGDGNDTLVGGAGADRLIGGAGADRFVFQSISDSPVGPALRDTIEGFDHGQDRINLAAIDANLGAAGDQAFTFIGTAGFSGVAGQLRYSVYGEVCLVGADVNGDRVADFQIAVSGTTWMTGTDFIL